MYPNTCAVVRLKDQPNYGSSLSYLSGLSFLSNNGSPSFEGFAVMLFCFIWIFQLPSSITESVQMFEGGMLMAPEAFSLKAQFWIFPRSVCLFTKISLFIKRTFSFCPISYNARIQRKRRGGVPVFLRYRHRDAWIFAC